DFVCAADAAEKLDALDRSNAEPGIQLDIAEIEVLAGRHSAAAERVARVLTTPGLADGFRTVALFYQTWIALAMNPETMPTALIASWTEALDKVHALSLSVGWTFTGASAALNDGRGARPRSQQAIKQLTSMIEQMTRPT